MEVNAPREVLTLNGREQVYEAYTDEDQKVWQVLYDRQLKNLPTAATREFMTGIAKIDFNRDQIPSFESTNQKLRKLTGWEVVAVPGIVDDQLFFELMADRKFPATTWLRKMEELDYLEEPDMFHDVFAHVPLLTNQAFVDFLQALSQIGLEYVGNAHGIDLLSRIYWYTIEFGLIRESGDLRIYGAGVLSSAGETSYSLSDQPIHRAYDVSNVLDTTYRKNSFQQEYFIIDSYADLYRSIDSIKKELKARV